MASLVLADRYEIIEKIGDGGMAVVYKARDRLLSRFVAIKILRKEHIGDTTFVNNFIREAKAAASLLHPNIVTIYDVGKDRDVYYIVMEYVEGRALSDVIAAEAPLDYKRVISIGKQMASALSLAHRNNIVHRDVKPHNILMTADGTAKITDFGIAKAVGDGTIISENGMIMGSVHYFSPEQSRGQYVDEKSDIYSLGIVLYEMLTGRVPFDADNPVTIAIMHMNDSIIPPSRFVKGVPPGLDQIVLKATQKYQSDRFGNIDEMYKALDNVNFITGIIDDPEIAGFVKPANLSDDRPGQGRSISARDEEERLRIWEGGGQTAEDEGLDAAGERGIGSYDEGDAAGEASLAPTVAGRQDAAFTGGRGIGSYDEGDAAGEASLAPTVAGRQDAAPTGGRGIGSYDEGGAAGAAGLAPTGGRGIVSYDDDDDDYEDDDERPGFLALLGSLFRRDDSEEGKLPRKWKILAIVAAVIVALLIAYPISRAISGIGADRVTVPNVIGMSEAEATQALEAQGFTVNIEYKEIDPNGVAYQIEAADSEDESGEPTILESGTFYPDMVMLQNPQANAKARQGSKVKLTVAKAAEGAAAGSSAEPAEDTAAAEEETPPAAAETAAVPNIVGMTKEGAEAAINSSGFRPGNVAYSASDAPSGQVVAQSPKSGEMLEKGKAISYTVSTGPATKTVPTVAGQSSEAAQAAIATAGFLLGNIAEEFSDIYEAGLVTRTDPAAGTEQKEGTAISIFVSKGKGITVPSLVGEALSKSEIKARLSGLKVSFVEVPIDEVDYDSITVNYDSITIGTVLDQSIAGGEVVAEGTEITVTIVVEDVDDDDPEEIEV